ncbi:MAG: hypothetical protein R6U38_11865 [Desulfatiglandaceae bacterium]
METQQPSKAERTIQERMAEEDRIQERIDEKGRKWRKVYLGGGAHGRNWIEQFKELGEIKVEEVESSGLKCFEAGGEKLYRVWLKMDPAKLDNLF